MVVLWDIDGTLVLSSLERHFFAYLREHHHRTSISRTVLHVLRLGLSSWPPMWYKMKLAYLRGLPAAEVDDLFERCWSERIERCLFAGTIEAVRLLRERRVRQVLLTGGPRTLAARLARYLQIDDLVAADPVLVDGRYTGAVTQPHPRGRRKVRYAETWLRENVFGWRPTVAVGNHFDDRFLLERASTAIVVNPDRRLASLAQSRGWEQFDPRPIESGGRLAEHILAAARETTVM